MGNVLQVGGVENLPNWKVLRNAKGMQPADFASKIKLYTHVFVLSGAQKKERVLVSFYSPKEITRVFMPWVADLGCESFEQLYSRMLLQLF